jgi:hypothetical protein
MDELQSLLARWANFYLAIMQTAAALIGLLFVIIALGAQQGVNQVDEVPKIRVYMTPTAIYFASVLILGALLSFPNHTAVTATICTVLSGAGGLVYVALTLIGSKKTYEVRHDFILYAILPSAAYGLLLVGGILLLSDAQVGLTLIALGMLSLITISVRNSWAIAINIIRPSRR